MPLEQVQGQDITGEELKATDGCCGGGFRVYSLSFA